MRFLFLQSRALLVAAAALRPTPPISGRRAALGSFAAGAIAFVARPSHADQLSEGGALGATCLGFGCNPYGRPDFNGLEDAPENSMPYPDFLKAIKDKKVEGVVFQPPMGNEAYAIIGGKSVRIGKGWPVEVSNSWSSPVWVVRILENEGVPYAWNFNLKAKSSYKDKMRSMGTPAPKYDPRATGAATGGSPWFAPPADVGMPPKMYGDGTF